MESIVAVTRTVEVAFFEVDHIQKTLLTGSTKQQSRHVYFSYYIETQKIRGSMNYKDLYNKSISNLETAYRWLMLYITFYRSSTVFGLFSGSLDQLAG